VKRRSPSCFFLIAVVAALAVALYLGLSAGQYRNGYPLDDAWIHQTYARNLAETGAWTFAEGLPSAGSTSPLWTMLLTPAYLLGIPPLVWTSVLAMMQLLAGAWIGICWLEQRGSRWAGWVGIVMVAEWHLVWAGLSGMETLLMGLAALGFFLLLEDESTPPFLLGVWIGAAIWIRPDAITLVGPLGWVIFFRTETSWTQRVRMAFVAAAGAAVLLLPYLLFNQAMSGEFWPTTFYAKQAEYAVLREMPFLRRLAAQFALPFIGVGALLAPGVLSGAYESARRQAWSRLGPLLWVAGYLTLYAMRLPVHYQHGRYAMPVLPTLLVLGWEGLAVTLKPSAELFVSRLLSRVVLLAQGVVLFVFLFIGATAYARDVAIIESEMVATAEWLRDELPPGRLLAVHDIGAVGYFSGHRLVDLAGLVSPDVIPIIRDEAALAALLDERGVDYLVTFPGWYPQLTGQAERVYTTGASFSPEAGGENMAVYLWR